MGRSTTWPSAARAHSGCRRRSSSRRASRSRPPADRRGHARIAAANAGVAIVTGDTRSSQGAAPTASITTSGVGRARRRHLGPDRVRPGELLPLGHARRTRDGGHASPAGTGGRGRHRLGHRPINGLVEALLDALLTRGGCGMRPEAASGPSPTNSPERPTTGDPRRGRPSPYGRSCWPPATCSVSPLYVANEGKFVAVVPTSRPPAAVAALRSTPGGAYATGHPADRRRTSRCVVAIRTAFGGTRIVDMLVGIRPPKPASADASAGVRHVSPGFPDASWTSSSADNPHRQGGCVRSPAHLSPCGYWPTRVSLMRRQVLVHGLRDGEDRRRRSSLSIRGSPGWAGAYRDETTVLHPTPRSRDGAKS